MPKPAAAPAADDTSLSVANDVALDAFEKGLQAAAQGVKPDTAEITPLASDPEEIADGDTVTLGEDGQPVAKPADAKPAEDDEGEDDAAAALAGQPEAKPAAKPEAKPATPARDDAVEKEIKDLGIKEAAQARFRELSARAKEGEQLRVQLKELGIEDLSKLPETVEQLRHQATRAVEWDSTVQSTGASPEQFGAALGYLALINSGDPGKMKQAYDAMQTEQAWLAKQLGLTAPGYDPLDEDPELKQKVADGLVPREVAERTIAAERAAKLRETRQARETETEKQAREYREAVQAATQEIAVLGTQLKAADPVGFPARLAAITPGIRVIQAKLPPSEWPSAIKELFDETPAPTPVPRPRVGNMPLRPAGHAAGNMQRKPTNDMEAFEAGLAAASGRGIDG